MRGFGAGRFYDRNSLSTSAELRQRAWDFNFASTHVELEVAPFLDVGRVFPTGTSPLTQLHKVGGLAFRAIARPFVVGYVDIGFGSEGPLGVERARSGEELIGHARADEEFARVDIGSQAAGGR